MRLVLLFQQFTIYTGRPAIVLFLGSWYFGHMVDFRFRKQFFPHRFIKSKHKNIAYIDSSKIRGRKTIARTRHHQIFSFRSKITCTQSFRLVSFIFWLVDSIYSIVYRVSILLQSTTKTTDTSIVCCVCDVYDVLFI